MEEPFVPNHLHLLVRGHLKHPPFEPEVLNGFFEALVKRVRMKILYGPQSLYCHDLGNEGITGGVTLSTSHSSIHIWNLQEGLFQFDLYSCSQFAAEEVIDLINIYFGVKGCDWVMIDRNERDLREIGRGKAGYIA